MELFHSNIMGWFQPRFRKSREGCWAGVHHALSAAAAAHEDQGTKIHLLLLAEC
jgi:hypothetical protein